MISQVYENIIPDHIESCLYTTDNQFVFKVKNTDQCLYLLNEVIGYYKSHNSPVFICFMDIPNQQFELVHVGPHKIKNGKNGRLARSV